MIKTITKLMVNAWQPVSSINTIKPINPIHGDIYYDINKHRNYVFADGIWKELRVSGKNALFNRNRMRKIKSIFSE